MKKTYQIPSIKWLATETEDMMVASRVEKGFNTDEAPETSSTSGNLSRHNIWDDEEE